MSTSSGYSIARPIFQLVIAAIVMATGITFLITFAGPPPRPAPVALNDVVSVLKRNPHLNAEGERLPIVQAPPVARSGEMPDAARDVGIASQLGGEVRGYYAEPARGGDTAIRGSFTIGWRPSGSTWRTVGSRPNSLFVRWLTITLGAMLAAIAVMAAVAWGKVRAISRPLEQLARAATGARLGTLPPTIDSGPREITELAASLAVMHERIGAQVEGRTAMLVAITHDLGTPLSRIAFWIEQLPESARVRAVADIEEMRTMLADVLRFARDEQTAERIPVEVGSVIDSLVDDLSVAGAAVTMTEGPRAVIKGDPRALRRLFANLIDNAIRYGERAHVEWAVDPGRVRVTIDDAGPGFDAAIGDRLFQPFMRGDPSRNRATGGTGLGLAIVRSIVEAHGGEVALGRSPGGGRVEILLPLG